MSENLTRAEVVVGAVADLFGYLATRPESVKIGAHEDSAVLADLVRTWLARHGLMPPTASAIDWKQHLDDRPASEARAELTDLEKRVAEIEAHVKGLDEALNWKATAEQAQRNSDFHRGLLLQVADKLGSEVYIADDGTRMQDPLLLKVPELVAKLDEERIRLRKAIDYGAMNLNVGIDLDAEQAPVVHPANVPQLAHSAHLVGRSLRAALNEGQ